MQFNPRLRRKTETIVVVWPTDWQSDFKTDYSQQFSDAKISRLVSNLLIVRHVILRYKNTG